MTHSPVLAKVVMVHSYKGGTGKTAIAVNLARFFSENKAEKVLLIEQDIGGSAFTSIFNIYPDSFWNDFYTKQKSLNDLIIKAEHFDVICAKKSEINPPESYGQSLKTYYAIQMERFKREIEYLKGKYDHIILDTRPGYSIDLISSIATSDLFLLITRIDNDNIDSTIEMYKEIYSQFQNKSIIFIQNQIPKRPENLGEFFKNPETIKSHKRWQEFIKDKLLLTIPLRNDIAYFLSNSKLLTLENPFYEYISQLSNLIEKVRSFGI